MFRMVWSLGFVIARSVIRITSQVNRSPRVSLDTPHLPLRLQLQVFFFQLWGRPERCATVCWLETSVMLQRASAGRQACNCRIELFHISMTALIRRSAWPKQYLLDMEKI